MKKESFRLTPPPPPPHTHTIMDMQNNKRHNVLTRARVNFSQSETSWLLRGGSYILSFEILLWACVCVWGGGGLTERILT